MLNTIEKLFAVLVKILGREASKHAKAAYHKQQKAHYHRIAENKAIENIKEAGGLYRTSLYQAADIAERQADKASALASKIRSIIE